MRRQHRLYFHHLEHYADDFKASDAVEAPPIAVWASLEPTGGAEGDAADQRRSNPTYKIGCRWGVPLAACDSTWWATRDNPTTGQTETFNFESVVNVGERNREFEIVATRAE